MFAKVKSCGYSGLDGFLVEVEADVSNGMIGLEIVGLPDSAVKESRDRVRTALKNCTLPFPQKKVTINLAPASVKKEGTFYDLPIAVAVLAASGLVDKALLQDYLFIGELALDGKLRPVHGVLPMAMAASEMGIKNIILPIGNAKEAAVCSELNILPANNLFEVFKHFDDIEMRIEKLEVSIDDIFKEKANHYDSDFSEVRGQMAARRAVEIAVSGGHNLIMIGPPGSGKSMIAKRIPGILPDLTYDEALETTKIHSVANLINGDTGLITKRPFRSPHHTVSAATLTGGGANAKPGELSLAHNGVLFMDELPEFHRDVLEALRQPLEDREVRVARVKTSALYPCNTLLVASMNPCKCGYYGDSKHICKCTPQAISKYRARISGPLMDRIDLHIEVPAVEFDDLKQGGEAGESSAEIKKRVNKARQIQLERYRGKGIYSNSQMNSKMIEEFCILDAPSQALLKMAFSTMGFSARAHDRILKIARTIADLAGEASILQEHIAEAITYRNLDRKEED